MNSPFFFPATFAFPWYADKSFFDKANNLSLAFDFSRVFSGVPSCLLRFLVYFVGLLVCHITQYTLCAFIAQITRFLYSQTAL